VSDKVITLVAELNCTNEYANHPFRYVAYLKLSLAVATKLVAAIEAGRIAADILASVGLSLNSFDVNYVPYEVMAVVKPLTKEAHPIMDSLTDAAYSWVEFADIPDGVLLSTDSDIVRNNFDSPRFNYTETIVNSKRGYWGWREVTKYGDEFTAADISVCYDIPKWFPELQARVAELFPPEPDEQTDE
jgi:hypothetical protein